MGPGCGSFTDFGGLWVSGWDLQPQGISQVLKTTGEAASHLEKYAKSYGEH
ncbi:DUF6507 family protein, partial [Streptomyces sp. WAC00469]|uniref:DUF6507 family protein n=1 Tax=Streptomyces sp. WAC00469 TaxID=2487415 RepID=UPI0028AE5DBB